MSFFFSDDQVAKLQTLIPKPKILEREHNSPAYLAKEILQHVNVNNIKMDNGVITVCQGKETYSYNYYTEEECKKAEEDLREEFYQLFGVEADVKIFLSRTKEQEPDPPPPLYWGGTETVYYYALTLKVK